MQAPPDHVRRLDAEVGRYSGSQPWTVLVVAMPRGIGLMWA